MSLSNNKSKLKEFLIITAILVFDTVFLYYLKYRIQELSFSEFTLNYFGNVLNLIFFLLILAGLIFNNFKKENSISSKFILRFLIIQTIILIVASILVFANYSDHHHYLFSHPVSEVIKGFVFSLFQFSQFILLMILWLNLFRRKKLIYLKSVLYSAALVLVLLLFSFFYTNQDRENYRTYRTNNKLVVGVVLGAAVWSNNRPSPSLSARVDKAIDLYNKKLIDKIQLTGSNAPGEMSEAKVALFYLYKRLVNIDDIWLEENTTSTTEQVRFIKDNLINQNNVGNIVIISDSYHLTRVRAICNFYKIKAFFAASNLKLNFQSKVYYKMRESVALLIFWMFAL